MSTVFYVMYQVSVRWSSIWTLCKMGYWADTRQN